MSPDSHMKAVPTLPLPSVGPQEFKSVKECFMLPKFCRSNVCTQCYLFGCMFKTGLGLFKYETTSKSFKNTENKKFKK